ncbi:MAG: hypothetical protein D3922_05905 [Candidatus Electrothrix sp. AR1]|nr:hypothetical protein [Candidatus Electrothrix sp. AR1]
MERIRNSYAFKLENEQEHLDVFTYVPSENATAPSESLEPDPNYVEVMTKGAEQHGITELVSLLNNIPNL